MLESNLSGKLWPVHVKPQQDELLSSWVARLALAHGLTMQRFSRLVWPGQYLMGRNIDLWNDPTTIQTLAEKTNTPPARVFATTLASYQGWLLQEMGYHAPWVLARHLSVRPQECFGLQYCPWCLSSDEQPYFRRHWRLAFVVLCPSHRTLLLDRCQECGAAVCYERHSSKNLSKANHWTVTQCHRCNSDLRDSANNRYYCAVGATELAFQESLCTTLRQGWVELPHNGPVYSQLFFAGLYHMIGRLIDGQIGCRLQTVLRQRYGINLAIDFSHDRIYIERLDVAQRRGLLLAVDRLLQHWPDQFVEFCRVNNLASHLLIRNKRPMPFWYWRVIREHLTKSPYQVSKEEIVSILKYLHKEGDQLSLQNLRRFLSFNAIRRARQTKLIKTNDYTGFCPLCRATEHQFKGGFSKKGIQVFRCGECHRSYKRPDYPSLKIRTRTFKRHPATVRYKALALYQAGNNHKQIGQLLSIPRSTVIYWCSMPTSLQQQNL